MSGTDDPDEDLESIRQKKAERLRQRAGDDGAADREGTPDAPVHVEGADHLQELLDAHDVVVVDFYADWCGPCKMLEPVVESIAADTPAVVAKVDIDAHQQLAAQSNVRGVPTLVVYADGQPAERLVGVQDESRLRSVVERVA